MRFLIERELDNPANKKWTPDQVVKKVKENFKNYNIDCAWNEDRDLGIWVSIENEDHKLANALRDQAAHLIFNLMRRNDNYEYVKVTSKVNATKDTNAYMVLLFNKVDSL